ncbi:MAG: rRNA maturation RNase YbeY [Candidatus Gastranaerophilales bacterium]|nr:rRNA maturation RNase YbeY [Candidatus Gastranaerophilales bacterium]
MTKKTKINIFIENIYENFTFDEVAFHEDVKKMFSFALTLPEITDKYCLKDYSFKTLVFDIVLCNDEEIQRINKEYRHIDRPTDVITFAIFADSAPDEVFILDDEINLGEILISLDTIKIQAEQNKVSFDDEMRLIAAHGILHFLGFDHQSDDDYNFVVTEQNKIKGILNV